MKLRVKRAFFDKEANRYRPSGEVFEVPEKRARVILAAGVAEVVEATEETTEPIVQEPEQELEQEPEQEPEEDDSTKDRRSKGKKG